MLSECRKSPRVRVFRVQSETSRGARGPQTLQSYRDDERRGRGSRSCAGSDPQPHVGVGRRARRRRARDRRRRAWWACAAAGRGAALAPRRCAAARGGARSYGTDNRPYRGYFAVPVAVPYRNQTEHSRVKSICFFFGCPLFLRGREPGGERENTPVIPGRGGLQGAATVIRDPRRPTRSLHSD